MKNITVIQKGKEGLRIGLWAFILHFVLSGILALIVNVVAMGQLNQWINGSLSDGITFQFSRWIRTISFTMNISVFNGGGVIQNGGEFHIGVLIFAIIPIIAFWVADRRENKIKIFGVIEFVVYGIASLVFALLLMGYSFITRGDILGIQYDFASLKNLIMTVVITLCIQFFISLNYNKTFSSGFNCTRWLLRILLGISFIVGAVGMFGLLQRYIQNVWIVVGMIIAVLPNVAVYIMFGFMGMSVEFGEQLTTLMKLVNIDVGFTMLSLPMRMTLIGAYFALVFFLVLRIKKERYLRELIVFAVSFSFISFILAYVTTFNLGFVKNLLDVRFGLNVILAFVVPFASVLLSGLFVVFARILKKELS